MSVVVLSINWIWGLIELQDAAKKLKESLTGKASPDREENNSATQDSEDAETTLSEPSSDDRHSESFEEASPSCVEYDRMFSSRCVFQFHDNEFT